MTIPAPPGPLCAACDAEAGVQWQRRPQAEELAALVAAEQSSRDQLLLLADPQQPAPVFGPLPTAADVTVAVYACLTHAISLDLADHVHQAACTAPNPATVPGCDCTPEPLPAAAPLMRHAAETVSLSTGWVVSKAAAKGLSI